MNSSQKNLLSLQDEIKSTTADDSSTNQGDQRREFRVMFMYSDAVYLTTLLFWYMLKDIVKNTMLAKLMKCYCVFALIALLTYFFYTLMEFRISASSAICSITIYVSLYCIVASAICRVLVLVHICFYNCYSHKMILQDITDKRTHKLQTFYVIVTVTLPLMMIIMLIFHSHVLFDMRLAQGNYCLSFSLLDPFIMLTVIAIVALIRITGAVIIIVLLYLLYKAWMQKKVDDISKRLRQSEILHGAVFGIIWVITTLSAPYDLVIIVLISDTLENFIITVLIYRILLIQKSSLPCVQNMKPSFVKIIVKSVMIAAIHVLDF